MHDMVCDLTMAGNRATLAASCCAGSNALCLASITLHGGQHSPHARKCARVAAKSPPAARLPALALATVRLRPQRTHATARRWRAPNGGAGISRPTNLIV